MDLDPISRAEIEAARRKVRQAAPEHETAPDPSELPPLPTSPLEVEAAPAPDLAGYIPERFLEQPSRSFADWRQVWEKDLRFRFSSHRGAIGRLIVGFKRLLAPLVRAPLSDLLERDRIFHLVLIGWLEDIRRYQRGLRDPYSYVRDWAVPDLVARMDALFSILERRVDTLEAADASAAAPIDRDWSLACLGLLRGCKRVLALVPDGAAVAELLRGEGIDVSASDPARYRFHALEQAADLSLGGLLVEGAFDGLEPERVVEALRLAQRKLAGGAPIAILAPGRALAYSLLLPALGFRALAGAGGPAGLERDVAVARR